MRSSISETRAESVAAELMQVRGWNPLRPPKGNVLWKNEYRSFPEIAEGLLGKGKKGAGGDGYPDFLITTNQARVLMVGETKAKDSDIGLPKKKLSTMPMPWATLAWMFLP